MQATRYFVEQVLARRHYLTVELCADVVANPISRTVQADGRIRLWGRIRLPGEDHDRILRVVLLEDGSTLHNAFIDRGFHVEDV